MAQVFGQPSRNAAEQSFRQTKNVLVVAMCIIGGLGVIGGYAIGAAFPIRGFPFLWVLLIDALMWIATWLIGKWGVQKIDAIDRQRMSWRKGAIGEALVAGTLASLPDDFVVINDVSKRFGNIDHVVVGPTGVYVIDAKNWRGIISADGGGELLLNGKPIPKPAVKTTIRAVMDFQNKLKALVEKEHFVRGLLVFPMAYVEAKFGSTGHIHCLRDDCLVDYIQNQAFSTKLAFEDIKRIKRATLHLAIMDENFES
jgi:Nuclease-related domain